MLMRGTVPFVMVWHGMGYNRPGMVKGGSVEGRQADIINFYEGLPRRG